MRSGPESDKYTRSGDASESPRNGLPLHLSILAIAPAEGRTPLWVRLKGLTFSHIVIVMGGWVWSQPWRGTGRCVPVEQWLREAGEDREYVEVGLVLPDHDPELLAEAFDNIAGRKTQRLRTILRAMGLWRGRPWNCTSPVLEVLHALGIDDVWGDTPDAIIDELGG